MRRREFITLLGGAAAGWPLAGRAQQAASRTRLVAILDFSGGDDPRDAAFRKRLAEIGWREGRNIQIEVRRSENDINRARTFAAELIAMKPDVFFATNTQMVQLILDKTPRHSHRVR